MKTARFWDVRAVFAILEVRATAYIDVKKQGVRIVLIETL